MKLDHEMLTILALIALAIMACITLGAGAKEILLSVTSGLLGYLTKGALQQITTPKPPILSVEKD
jgi:hypothetical protein